MNTTYSVIPDVNDDSGDTMPLDYAGTFAENIESREYACDVARIVSRCIKCHVFVILDDSATTCEYENVAIYRRGALVTEEQYATYCDTVLFAHEHAPDLPDLPDLPERIMLALANGEERSDAQLCALLHVVPALVDDAIHALYESDRIACDARCDAIYVRALA